ncbi:YdcF family protein [Aspergillus puulaauensis]|uniref:DUF218 domain-containing protein n=1 Tax=Aspergillus puulaauensis TaxID=1220207 RepID=A0A7R7XF08_9EURO|nr:uncharacterized protein APUU_20265S [Aspergillus puulaauensis]BCS19833.1 hypothetical protein APUU_20265S [Aspergillus puulaauensis]
MTTCSPETVSDINALSEYLSDPQLDNLSSAPPVDCMIICASQVLFGAETIFHSLEQRPDLTKSLVLCGGIGHSTKLLYAAVRRHPRYSNLAKSIEGLPEARVLERILDGFFDRNRITAQGCHILIEDQSTNCGQNALFSRRVLEQAGFREPKSGIINQDPTMMLRTKASFEMVYSDMLSKVSFHSLPGFVPKVRLSDNGLLAYKHTEGIPGLWGLDRFIELLLGEIPRVRDDEEGYGPRGRGFISHVDLPADIELAWTRLRVIFEHHRLR